MIVDLGFFTANVVKLFQGGWVPAVVAAVVAGIMTIWIAGPSAAQREDAPR